MGQRINLGLQRFGRLLVIGAAESLRTPGGSVKARWRCRCDCGAEVDVRTADLRRGRVRSCGCLRAERRDPYERMMRRVERNGECLEYSGSLRNGYPAIGGGGRDGATLYGHRLAYERHKGPIPEGLQVCHRCDNPRCVNPEHLFLGTHADNARDREAKGRGRRPGDVHRAA